MLRSSWSRVTRSAVVAGTLASSVLAANDARAARHYGLIPPYPTRSSHGVPGLGPLAGDTAAQCGVVTYCGGPVLSNVQIVPVYWTKNSTTVTGWAPTYLKTIADSTFMDMLSEYSTKGKTGEVCSVPDDGGLSYFGPSTAASTGQTITRGTALAGVQITPTVTTGTSITDDNADIGAELTSQIKAGKLPAPTYDAQGYPNTIYFVFFPASYKITLQGGASCAQFGGYHYSTPYTAEASCTGQYVPYAVIPDCAGSTTDDLSAVVSHELAEAVTDTDVGPTNPNYPTDSNGGWYLGPDYPCPDPNNCPSSCGEVGDVCQGAGNATITGTAIIAQEIWSQAQSGSCDISNPGLSPQTPPSGTPLTTCPSKTPDAGAQTDGGGASDAGGSDSGATRPADDGGSVFPSDDAGGGATTIVDGGSGGNGGNGFESTPSSSAGCACTTAPGSSSGALGALGALFAVAVLATRRRSDGRAERRD